MEEHSLSDTSLCYTTRNTPIAQTLVIYTSTNLSQNVQRTVSGGEARRLNLTCMVLRWTSPFCLTCRTGGPAPSTRSHTDWCHFVQQSSVILSLMCSPTAVVYHSVLWTPESELYHLFIIVTATAAKWTKWAYFYLRKGFELTDFYCCNQSLRLNCLKCGYKSYLYRNPGMLQCSFQPTVILITSKASALIICLNKYNEDFVLLAHQQLSAVCIMTQVWHCYNTSDLPVVAVVDNWINKACDFGSLDPLPLEANDDQQFTFF